MGLFLLAGTVASLPAQAQAPKAIGPALPTYTLTLTGYNAVPDQTDSDPFTTASGAYSNPEVVAARSQDLADELPFGTIVAIKGPSSDNNGGCAYTTVSGDIGYRVIADTMNARFKHRIDVLFGLKDRYLLPSGETMNAASLIGACPGTRVAVVGFIDISNPGKLPKTQAELAAIVEKGPALAVR